jgi:hypothetical protein
MVGNPYEFVLVRGQSYEMFLIYKQECDNFFVLCVINDRFSRKKGGEMRKNNVVSCIKDA